MGDAKVVARYQDGRVLTGYTRDFAPLRDTFLLTLKDASPGSLPVEIRTAELKALFFVKDFQGKPLPDGAPGRGSALLARGPRVRVVFKDQERITGTAEGARDGAPGFFLYPLDPESNIERCFVVASATEEIADA